MLSLETITLEGDLVQLIPLEKAHSNALLEAAQDGNLWELWYTSAPSENTIDQYLANALQQQKNQTSLPFVIFHKKDKKIIGTTRYCNIDRANHRLEIGYTWYAKTYQRTGVNTECKYLLLKNAFENYDAIAVEFRTHWHNHASRNAILRLGAKQDGVLRNHRVDRAGVFRDTVVFSIIQSEWKAVKKGLEFKRKR
ncbi:MAG: GNAT family protein [Bacteroidota bacterium]